MTTNSWSALLRSEGYQAPFLLDLEGGSFGGESVELSEPGSISGRCGPQYRRNPVIGGAK